MSHAPSPPVLTLNDDAANSGAFTLITATASGAAQTIITPSAVSPDRQHIYIVVGTVHTAAVTLSIGAGGVALGQVFELSIPSKSGLNIVMDWEEYRGSLGGSIVCWASVASVLMFKVASRVVKGA